MEFPPDWTVLPAVDFDIAAPRDPGELGMDLMAQVRSNGRIMDHFRISMGGSRTIRSAFHTKAVYTNNSIIGATLKYEVWPRDIIFRRNMTSTEWLDLTNLVAANDILAYRPGTEAGGSEDVIEEELCNEAIMAFLNGLTEKTHCGASVRWAVGVGADNKLELVLQGLPASATVLAGKPPFRG